LERRENTMGVDRKSTKARLLALPTVVAALITYQLVKNLSISVDGSNHANSDVACTPTKAEVALALFRNFGRSTRVQA
jgi:hypothetical protein